MPHHPAIARNRTALLAVVATIITLLGGRNASTTVARHLRNAALALLRPAEAATRRLIVILARGLVLRPRQASAFPAAFGERASGGARAGAFQLLDQPKRFSFKPKRLPPQTIAPRGVPRIRSFWAAPVPASPPAAVATVRPGSDALVDVTRLTLRIAALERALVDLPKQARRLVRWRNRNFGDSALFRKTNKVHCHRNSPLRPGRPPGFRETPDRDIDLVLRECHALAVQALNFQAPLPNTS